MASNKTRARTAVRPAVPVETRDRVVRAARDLMLTHSYLGLNLQELADEVGIRKASLYHHFPSKQAVGVAVIEDATRRFASWAESLAGETAEGRLVAFVQMVRDALRAGSRVCLAGATASEWDCVEPQVRAAMVAFSQLQLNWLEQVVEGLKALRSRPRRGHAAHQSLTSRQWALHIASTCQGALLSARVHADPALYDAAVAPLLAQLAAPA